MFQVKGGEFAVVLLNDEDTTNPEDICKENNMATAADAVTKAWCRWSRVLKVTYKEQFQLPQQKAYVVGGMVQPQ